MKKRLLICCFLFFYSILANSIARANEVISTLTIINHSGRSILFTTVEKGGDRDLIMPIITNPTPTVEIENGKKLQITLSANPEQKIRFINDIIFAVNNAIYQGCAFYAKISAQFPYGVAFLEQAAKATSSKELSCAARINNFHAAEFIIFPNISSTLQNN